MSEQETQAEDAKAEDAKAEDAKAEDAKAEDAKAEDAEAEDAEAEDAEAEDQTGDDQDKVGTKSVLDTLDLARGEVNEEDVATLKDAIDNLDFATRKAEPALLEQIRALAVRLTDLVDQIERGVRPASDEAERQLTPEQEDKYQRLFDAGIAAAEQGNLREAADHLEEAVRLDPDGIGGLFNLGVVYGLLAHKNITTMEFYDDYVRDEVYVERAQICYDAVLTQDPNHLRSLINLATLASLRDDRQSAVEYLRRAVAVKPEGDEAALVEKAKAQLKELGEAPA